MYKKRLNIWGKFKKNIIFAVKNKIINNNVHFKAKYL